MKQILLALLAAVSMGAITSDVSAQSDNPPTRKVFAQNKSLTATVEDIDYDQRKITLKGPEGPIKFGVSDEAKKFSEIKKGDVVKISYYESVAVAFAKPGGSKPAATRTTVTSREPGKKPAGMATTITEVNATVEDIDRENREVTLKGPRGNRVKVEVDPEVGTLENIKKGDKLAITYTEALALSVEKPDGK